MRNNEIIISLADESAYNRKVPAYKYGGGDKSNLTIDLSGRPTFNVDVSQTQLPTALLEGLWKSAKLFEGIQSIGYLDVDSLILWSLQTTGNTVSKNTCELFLKAQCLQQNLVAKKNSNTGKTYYERTDEFNKEYALATARRNYEKTVLELKASGATK